MLFRIIKVVVGKDVCVCKIYVLCIVVSGIKMKKIFIITIVETIYVCIFAVSK